MAKEPEEESEDNLVLIDEHALDKEWVKQPGLVWKFAKRMAKAKLDLARAKANLDVVFAEHSRMVRKRPDHYHLDKVTEDSVKMTVTLTTGYKEAQELLNQAKFKVDMLQAMLDALDHKKQGLENLVKLHGMDYFAEPSARGVNTKAMDDQIQRSVNAKLKPMKRKV